MKYKYVNLFLLREMDGKLVVPVRADGRKMFPGCYDFSVGGHVEEGESAIMAIRREMWEELRLKCRIRRIGEVRREGAGYFSMLYFGVLNKEITWFEPRETKEVRYFEISEVRELLRTQRGKFDNDYEAAFRMLGEVLEKERRV